MTKLRKAIAVSAIVQCAATWLGSVAVEAWDQGRHPDHELKEPSLLEHDERRFAQDEALLRKSMRRYADKDHIDGLQDRVRRDLRDIIDDRGRPENGAVQDSWSFVKRHIKQNLS